jgi:hypothetical protein
MRTPRGGSWSAGQVELSADQRERAAGSLESAAELTGALSEDRSPPDAAPPR